MALAHSARINDFSICIIVLEKMLALSNDVFY